VRRPGFTRILGLRSRSSPGTFGLIPSAGPRPIGRTPPTAQRGRARPGAGETGPNRRANARPVRDGGLWRLPNSVPVPGPRPGGKMMKRHKSPPDAGRTGGARSVGGPERSPIRTARAGTAATQAGPTGRVADGNGTGNLAASPFLASGSAPPGGILLAEQQELSASPRPQHSHIDDLESHANAPDQRPQSASALAVRCIARFGLPRSPAGRLRPSVIHPRHRRHLRGAQ
jgi:hypothetical protein